jgi:hypothetical protein
VVSRCPSDLELERLLAATARADGHVAACPRCAARLAELRRLGEEFAREVFPATVEAVVAASAPPRMSPRPFVWLVPALAAAAAVVVLALRVASPDGLLGGKADLSLVAYGQGPAGAQAIADGQVVPAGAGLRFEVRPGRSCNLFVAATDAAGQVARVFPEDGSEGRSVKAGAVLAVPAATGGQPGPRRFFAICGCGDEPVTWDGVERAARALGQGPERVRAAKALSGLPDDALQATLLVETGP